MSKVNLKESISMKLFVSLVFISVAVSAQRVPVLNQVELPHNYYFRELYLPQLTSGPSSATWSPDGTALIYSMSGSLWLQKTESDTAFQLTDGTGYDYQPDWSPDGNHIIFVRYNGTSIELHLLDLQNKSVIPLTSNGEVNVEPRWAADGRTIAFVSTEGTGHFLLFTAILENSNLTRIQCLTPDRKTNIKRYYYSAYDHNINPAWHPDGKNIIFISNNEIIHGTGNIVSMAIEDTGSQKIIVLEETSWRTKPDISPDGSRIVYSSYLGRNWHQLWLIPFEGGYPMPLTYGDFDNTCPRWSPDGKMIAFISNRSGNTTLWVLDVFDGQQREITVKEKIYLKPHHELVIKVMDEKGIVTPSRLSITDNHERFFAPGDAWIHADDSRYPHSQVFESHYFHTDGIATLMVPEAPLMLQVSHGPLYHIEKLAVPVIKQSTDTVLIQLKKHTFPKWADGWKSADVHVHMNYTGTYRNTPHKLIQQARAENLDVVYNLIVNKEQRLPDVSYFTPEADVASTKDVLLLHGQEYHTGFWGHLGLLHLNDHLIIPDYSAYPQTAVSSLFPHNNFIAERAHRQNALVGYVHPFEQSELFPQQSAFLTNELPADAALGNVDYYELIGFSDHKASELVWYHLLNCGIKIPAAAGTDAMANYASLRGPVGLNRIFLYNLGSLDEGALKQELISGKSFVTNGPLIGLKISNAQPGDSILLTGNQTTLNYSVFLRSNVPVTHLELVMNGEVIKSFIEKDPVKSFDSEGSLKVKGPGWVLLRAHSKEAHPDLPDLYPYASTNPVYLHVPGKMAVSKSSGAFFLTWLERLEEAVNAHDSFRNDEEKNNVLTDIHRAKSFYKNCISNSTLE